MPSVSINNKTTFFSSQYFSDTLIGCFSLFSWPKILMLMEFCFLILWMSLIFTGNFMSLNSSFMARSLSAVHSYHVTCFMYVFWSESTFYSCLNFNELLARNRCDIWSLNDFNGTRTRNHLVCKHTLNHLVKLVKCVLEWIHTL